MTLRDGGPRDLRPLATQVYERLRDMIVDDELSPSVPLVLEQVAELLGVSRTPVRDGLNRLAAEGLVTWIPGKGYLVNELTQDDVSQVQPVRLTLELLAAQLSCGKHDSASIKNIDALIEAMAIADHSDGHRMFELNRQFHQALIEPCANPFLLRMIDRLWEHPINMRITRSYIHGGANVPAMVQEHRQLLDATAANDFELLAQLLESHMATGYHEALVDSQPSDAVGAAKGSLPS